MRASLIVCVFNLLKNARVTWAAFAQGGARSRRAELRIAPFVHQLRDAWRTPQRGAVRNFVLRARETFE